MADLPEPEGPVINPIFQSSLSSGSCARKCSRTQSEIGRSNIPATCRTRKLSCKVERRWRSKEGMKGKRSQEPEASGGFRVQGSGFRVQAKKLCILLSPQSSVPSPQSPVLSPHSSIQHSALSTQHSPAQHSALSTLTPPSPYTSSP